MSKIVRNKEVCFDKVPNGRIFHWHDESFIKYGIDVGISLEDATWQGFRDWEIVNIGANHVFLDIKPLNMVEYKKLKNLRFFWVYQYGSVFMKIDDRLFWNGYQVCMGNFGLVEELDLTLLC